MSMCWLMCTLTQSPELMALGSENDSECGRNQTRAVREVTIAATKMVIPLTPPGILNVQRVL